MSIKVQFYGGNVCTLKVIISYSALDNMNVLRKRLREFRVSKRYFFEHMWDHILDSTGEVCGIKEITVELDNGREIPVVIDETVDEYEVIYVE